MLAPKITKKIVPRAFLSRSSCQKTSWRRPALNFRASKPGFRSFRTSVLEWSGNYTLLMVFLGRHILIFSGVGTSISAFSCIALLAIACFCAGVICYGRPPWFSGLRRSCRSSLGIALRRMSFDCCSSARSSVFTCAVPSSLLVRRFVRSTWNFAQIHRYSDAVLL